MRWFIFSLFFICFSLQAQVVCKDPNSAGGDKAAEAGSSSSLCRTNITDAVQGAVDIEVNTGSHVAILTSDEKVDEPPSKTTSSSTSGGGSGSIK